MKQSETGIFLLCLAVFVLMVAVFSYLVIMLLRLQLKCVVAGLKDDEIKREWEEQRQKAKKYRALKIAGNIVNGTALALLLCMLAVALVFTFCGDSRIGRVPVLKTVETGSMSFREESNRYLFDHDIHNQVGIDDLIVLRQLPGEYSLQLYDIVLYEYEGIPILHRIVEIKEPSLETGRGHRLFTLQGDAVPFPDAYPVLYSRMFGIYKGEHVPGLGSFVKFMRSPAGYICLLLIISVSVAYPLAEQKILRAKLVRLATMGYDVPEKGKRQKKIYAEVGSVRQEDRIDGS